METPPFESTPLNPTTPITPATPEKPAMPNKTPAANHILKWLTIVALGLAIISGLIFWFGGVTFSADSVDFTIAGPTQASVGDQITYKVTIHNGTKSGLTNLNLKFNYPDGAIVLDQNGNVVSNPSNSENITIASLNAGQQQEEDFYAFLIGDKGNIKTAKAVVDFSAGSITSSFEKTADLSTTITDLPVNLTLATPPTAQPGQQISYTLDYRNQSSNDIAGLQFVFKYPDGFTPTKFSPAPSKSPDTWSINNLKQGSSGRITVTGTLNGKEGDSKTFSATLQRNLNNSFVDYENTSDTTVLQSPLINVSLNVNGSAGYISHAGDTLQYTINYTNTSNDTFSGLNLSVHLDGSMYDFSTLDTKGGFFDSSANTITWNSTVVPMFNNFLPNQTGTSTFIVKLKQNVVAGGSNSSYVDATAQLVTPNVPSDIDANQISAGDDLVTKITSQPTFSETMYYNDPAFGSTGPIPPKVGQETDYTVHWVITNPGNDLSNAKVTATLPQGVIWKNVTSVSSTQPQPTYTTSNSQIVWNLGTIPNGTGVSSGKYELDFQIGIKPSPTQSGSPAALLSSPALSGTDSFTSQNIVIPANSLTTNDSVDKGSQGVVQ